MMKFALWVIPGIETWSCWVIEPERPTLGAIAAITDEGLFEPEVSSTAGAPPPVAVKSCPFVISNEPQMTMSPAMACAAGA